MARHDIYVNEESETALFQAARNNHFQLVRMLIRSGSDVKRTNRKGLTFRRCCCKNSDNGKCTERQRKQKTEKQDDDWATVAAIGIENSTEKSSNEGVKALFHDQLQLQGKKKLDHCQSMGTEKIYHKGSREHAIIEEITKMEKQLNQRHGTENRKPRSKKPERSIMEFCREKQRQENRNAGCTESSDSGSHEGG